MLGNILLGSYIYGDDLLGVSVTEVGSNLSLSTVNVVFRGQAVFSSWHTKFRIPDLDIIIDFEDFPSRQGTGVVFHAYGNFDEFGTTLYSGVAFGSYAIFIAPEIIASGPSGLSFKSTALFALEHPDENALAWSNIGALDFTIDKSNVAGTAPLKWKGYVYAICQLGISNILYVYGANGITRIVPEGIYFSQRDISNIGLKSKHAVVNTGTDHYFVSANDNLYKIGNSGEIVKLGYKEFIEDMGVLVMSYDSFNKLVYICDGTYGYVYSEDSDSLTAGPVNITAISYQDEVMYIGCPGVISIPDVLVVTDTYDMGTHKEKTIFEVGIVCNDLEYTQIAIDYKKEAQDDWATLPYKTVNPGGSIKVPCYGRFFRFRVRATSTSTDYKIESITVNGTIHGYNYLDIHNTRN